MLAFFDAIRLDLDLSWTGFASLVILVMVGSAIAGWVYEMLFYHVDSGGQWVRRGHGIGPWLPIYGFGALGIMFVCWDVRMFALRVILRSAVVTGLLELVTGWVLYRLCGGIRWWDYNTEIWNWGNIGGYVCLRSVAVFALAGYALMQIVVPLTAVLILYVGEGLAFPPTALLGAVYLADYIWGYFVKGF